MLDFISSAPLQEERNRLYILINGEIAHEKTGARPNSCHDGARLAGYFSSAIEKEDSVSSHSECSRFLY